MARRYVGGVASRIIARVPDHRTEVDVAGQRRGLCLDSARRHEPRRPGSIRARGRRRRTPVRPAPPVPSTAPWRATDPTAVKCNAIWPRIDASGIICFMLGSGMPGAALLLQMQPIEKRHDLVEHAGDHRQEHSGQRQDAEPERRARGIAPLRERDGTRSTDKAKATSESIAPRQRMNVGSVWRRLRRDCSQSVVTAYEPASVAPANATPDCHGLREARPGHELQRPQAEQRRDNPAGRSRVNHTG